MPSYRPVNALLRGLDVLATTSRLRGRATVGEVHRHTGLDKATIVRMLETLVHAGFVVRDDADHRYAVTGKTLALGEGFDRHHAVGAAVAPALAAFRAAVGWPSDVGVFDHDAMLVVETSREPGPMFLNRRPGYRAPVLATSLGRAYLAHCDGEERGAVLDRLVRDPAPWNRVARDRRAAERALARVRRRGYATMDPDYRRLEYAGRMDSIGVPIAAGGRVLAALNVLYLRSALTRSAAVASLLGPLREAAGRMAVSLGGDDDGP